MSQTTHAAGQHCFIDTHCHLALDAFDGDRTPTLERARHAGITDIIDVGIGPNSWQRTLALAAAEPTVWAALGLHPNDIGEHGEASLETLRALASSPRVVAIGETGLDYHWHRTTPELQQTVFLQHLHLAKELDLPIIIHCRDAYDDLVASLVSHGRQFTGVVHCFGGDAAQADRLLALGFHLGIGGSVTYASAHALRAIVGSLPAERLLLETDAPYLAPVPHRGQRNEPAHVRLIAAAVSQARGSDIETVAAQSTAAARQLFRLPYPPAQA